MSHGAGILWNERGTHRTSLRGRAREPRLDRHGRDRRQQPRGGDRRRRRAVADGPASIACGSRVTAGSTAGSLLAAGRLARPAGARRSTTATSGTSMTAKPHENEAGVHWPKVGWILRYERRSRLETAFLRRKMKWPVDKQVAWALAKWAYEFGRDRPDAFTNAIFDASSIAFEWRDVRESVTAIARQSQASGRLGGRDGALRPIMFRGPIASRAGRRVWISDLLGVARSTLAARHREAALLALVGTTRFDSEAHGSACAALAVLPQLASSDLCRRWLSAAPIEDPDGEYVRAVASLGPLWRERRAPEPTAPKPPPVTRWVLDLDTDGRCLAV